MKVSRRDFSFLVPMLAAAQTQDSTLPSKALPYDGLPVRIRGRNKMRPILNGTLHSGFAFELHETELAPGEAPHGAHRHVHEEVVLVREGSMEVLLSGRKTVLGPGSAAFIASGEEHGFRNAGTTTARYFLMALGPNWQYRDSVGRP